MTSRKRIGCPLSKTSKRVQIAIDAILGTADEIALEPEYEDSRLDDAPTWYGDWDGWTPDSLPVLLYSGLNCDMRGDGRCKLEDWMEQLKDLHVTSVNGRAMRTAYLQLMEDKGCDDELECDRWEVVDAIHLAGNNVTFEWVELVKANGVGTSANGVGTSVLLRGLYEYLVSEFVNHL